MRDALLAGSVFVILLWLTGPGIFRSYFVAREEFLKRLVNHWRLDNGKK